MHAVAIADFAARPEVMQLPAPRPGPGEILLRIRAVNFSNTTSADLLATLADQASSGKLRVRIDAEVPLDDAPAAIASARTGHARGKTVIIP